MLCVEKFLSHLEVNRFYFQKELYKNVVIHAMASLVLVTDKVTLKEGKLKADINVKKDDQGFKNLDFYNKLRYSFSCQSFSNVKLAC